MEATVLTMDLSSIGIIIAAIALTICISILTLICLKIKSTKKTPELLGTVGTVKPLQDSGEFKSVKTSPRLRPVSTISDVIHDYTDGSNRTPSRAGERRLPDIPRGDHGNFISENGSDLYATLGSALAEGGSDSEEAETEPTETNHPYAKVKKLRKSNHEHPYATVQQSSIALVESSNAASTNVPRPPPPPEPIIVDVRPQPSVQASNQPQYFSGDSQDSSKGYTSISVREPLRHIRGAAPPPTGASGPPGSMSNYAPVSETSDDMYAAIEDPTYCPTGNQSNSDTYAVINLPEDDIDEDEVELRSAHTYSQVDKSRKRKAISHQPTTKSSLPGGASNNNVDDMYAKVQKNNVSPPRRSWQNKKDPGYETVADPASADNLPVGASAMHTSGEQLLGARPRHHHHHHHRHINYSDFEVAHYDPNAKKNLEDQELGYETVPENRSFLPTNDHEGYERVEDYWRSSNSDDAGYELVRGNSKRRAAASAGGPAPGGFERLTFSSSSNKKTDPGYETVPPRPPLPRMNNHYHDPPYARLENAKDEEESEEGYETIPASEQRLQRFDPGYESVHHHGDKRSEPGYETVPSDLRDPGYETVETKVTSALAADPGYETVERNTSSLPMVAAVQAPQAAAPAVLSSTVNVVHHHHLSVRKTQSDPNNVSPVLMPLRGNNSSVVVIEHTSKMAVNNNIIGEKDENSPTTTMMSSGAKSSETDQANDQVQAHIFV